MKLFRSLAAAALLASAVPALALTDTDKDEVRAVIREYLIQNPEVIEEALNELKRKQEEAELSAAKSAIADNATALFRSETDLVMGNPDGKITMVEFFDYNCGYCKRAFPDIAKLIETDKDLRVVMKEFAILGPGSVFAARAALASRKQGKYQEFHIALMGHEGRLDEASVLSIAGATGLDVEKLKTDMEAEDIAATLAANTAVAEKLNIGGTPAFVVDQTLIPGAIGYEGLVAAVKEVRDAGGCKVC
jgi:protein-disulfide isomerase